MLKAQEIVVKKIVDNPTAPNYGCGMSNSSSPTPSSAAGTRAEGPLTQSLPEQIAARLSERIVSGAYAPGQRILEQAVAAEFAVSRGPVREALRLLEKDGLVTFLPRRGAQVTRLSIDEVKEIFDIRAMLNGLRDRLVAEDSARGEILPALEAEVANLARFAEGADSGDAYVDTVTRIDRILARACSNRRLTAILGSLMLQTLRYRQLGLASPERRRQSAQNWQKLIQAIRDGNGEAAERIARQRVLDSRDAAIESLQHQAAADASEPARSAA